MLTLEQARELVLAKLKALGAEDVVLVILDDETIERGWGWVFFYDSAKHHETGDFRDALAGNAPYIVNRDTGELLCTGTARPIEQYISDYEKTIQTDI